MIVQVNAIDFLINFDDPVVIIMSLGHNDILYLEILFSSHILAPSNSISFLVQKTRNNYINDLSG